MIIVMGRDAVMIGVRISFDKRIRVRVCYVVGLGCGLV